MWIWVWMGLCLVALWTVGALLWNNAFLYIYFCFIWENQKIWERELIFLSLFIEFLIQLRATVFRFDGETSRIEERRKPSAVPTHVHDDPHEDGIYLLDIFNNISPNIKREIHVSSQLCYMLCSELLGHCYLGHDHLIVKLILSRETSYLSSWIIHLSINPKRNFDGYWF